MFQTAKNHKMQFHEKKFLIYLISRVFLPGLFKIFWPTVKQGAQKLQTCSLLLRILLAHYVSSPLPI